MRILVFGESIAQGLYDSRGGWVNRLIAEANTQMANEVLQPKNLKPFVFNLGVMSNKVRDIQERLASEVEARLKSDELCIILAGGITDAALVENRIVTDERDFEHDYDILIETARDYTNRVICIGLTAVDEAVVEAWRARRNGQTWSNNRIKLFEDYIRQICQKKDIPFVPLHDSFLDAQSSDESLLTVDGVHPNDSGHKFIHDQVRQALDALLQ